MAMSPYAGEILLNQIAPIIQAVVPRVARTVGAEDHAELVQDAVCSAAQMLDAAERSGKPLYPSSIAYYAVQRTKGGRRSYGATRADVLCPAAQLDEKVSVASMDEPVAGEHDDEMTLHDMLAGPVEDVAQQAARELDWSELMEVLDVRDLALIRATANGDRLRRLARRFGVSGARVTQLKRELGAEVKRRWGSDVLAAVMRTPAWASSINASRERRACRYARAQEALALPGSDSGNTNGRSSGPGGDRGGLDWSAGANRAIEAVGRQTES
jgi:hypothetical protein